MADVLNTEGPDYRQVGHYLAGMSGLDLTRARPKTVRLWEARDLALMALASGNKEEAARIMAHAKGRLGKTESPANDAAKEQ